MTKIRKKTERIACGMLAAAMFVACAANARTTEYAEPPNQPPPMLTAEQIAALDPVTIDAAAASRLLRLPSVEDRPRCQKCTGAEPLQVSAKVCVHPEGFVYRAELVRLSDDQAFNGDFQTKVRRWRYLPYLKDGRSVPFCYLLNYSYEGR